jgi:DNA modification methylase
VNGRVIVLRGDAAHLPLPDESVDLIVTSPPYYGQRDYRDGGESLEGQIGGEETPREYIAALLDCTREWVRVLKPEGSIFVNLGDSYHSGKGAPGRTTTDPKNAGRNARRTTRSPLDYGLDLPRKTLLGLPWRYAIGCMDDLGLILRRDIIWHKANGMPESVSDRCRSSHEYLFHLFRQPRYYSALDEIRAPLAAPARKGGVSAFGARDTSLRRSSTGAYAGQNQLGVTPGSVWVIPSQPLAVPAHLGENHYAAFPMELPRRIVLGWSPSGICTACGEGRRPVTHSERIPLRPGDRPGVAGLNADGAHGFDRRAGTHMLSRNIITGYSCDCTPYADHPERRGKDFHAGTDRARQGMNDGNGGERYRRYVEDLENPRGPVREYDFERWTPPPARPSVVLDPFGGTGTTALVASVLGRTGITIDKSMDYARLARWRTTDPGERARAMGVRKPTPVPDGQGSLFDGLEAS